MLNHHTHRAMLMGACVAIIMFTLPGKALAVVHAMAVFYEKYAQPVPTDEQAQLHCLALNVYHEARGEPMAGKLAVAAVTLNRVANKRFPNDICAVVWQRKQFSWTRDGRPDMPRDIDAWKEAVRIARLVLHYKADAEIGDAIYFHTTRVRPTWASSFRRIKQVGQHVFYSPNRL